MSSAFCSRPQGWLAEPIPATREFIALAVAVTTHCQGCIDAHIRKAKAAGASKAELAEALGVALALDAGAALTYSFHVLDAMDGAGEMREHFRQGDP